MGPQCTVAAGDPSAAHPLPTCCSPFLGRWDFFGDSHATATQRQHSGKTKTTTQQRRSPSLTQSALSRRSHEGCLGELPPHLKISLSSLAANTRAPERLQVSPCSPFALGSAARGLGQAGWAVDLAHKKRSHQHQTALPFSLTGAPARSLFRAPALPPLPTQISNPPISDSWGACAPALRQTHPRAHTRSRRRRDDLETFDTHLVPRLFPSSPCQGDVFGCCAVESSCSTPCPFFFLPFPSPTRSPSAPAVRFCIGEKQRPSPPEAPALRPPASRASSRRHEASDCQAKAAVVQQQEALIRSPPPPRLGQIHHRADLLCCVLMPSASNFSCPPK